MTSNEIAHWEPTEIETTGGLFESSNPGAVVRKAAEAASELAAVIEDKGLYTQIGKSKHIRIEGWTLLGSMLGVFPYVVWSREIEGEGLDAGWEARVEVRTREGQTIGAAEAECMRSEKRWKDADDYAVRSMAQTRAASKALKMPLGFVFAMAGYETTPAEEMPVVDIPRPRPAPAPDAPTKEHRQHFIDLMRTLEGLDPDVNWPKWCLSYTGDLKWEQLDKVGAERLIVGLMEQVEALSPPTESSGSE